MLCSRLIFSTLELLSCNVKYSCDNSNRRACCDVACTSIKHRTGTRCSHLITYYLVSNVESLLLTPKPQLFMSRLLFPIVIVDLKN